MKTDLNSLKKELSRLTDTNYLKKELNRIASEIRKFDVHIPLTPQAKETLNQLEDRFRDVLKALHDLQKQVDSNFIKFKKVIVKTRDDAEKRIRTSMGLGGKKKATSKKSASKKASTSKAGGKKTATKKKASGGSQKTSKKTSKKSAQ